jgi:hypothetical protein
MIQFRWVALITLWTILSSPVFGPLWSSSGLRPRPRAARAVRVKTPRPHGPAKRPDRGVRFCGW